MNQHLERLNGLAPFLAPAVIELMTRCEKELGRKLLVVRGWSSYAEQLEKYKRGRTISDTNGEWVVVDPAARVTDAKPGTSAHNIVTIEGVKAAVGVDLIPIRKDGAADWEPGDKFWHALYAIAWDVGLDPMGDAIGAYLKLDKGHFEEPGWKWKLRGLGLKMPVGNEQVSV